MAEMLLQPCSLSGSLILLESLTEGHLDALAAVALDPELWAWTTVALANRDDVQQYIADALQAQKQGSVLPFVTILQGSNQVVGSTRFLNADSTHRRVEIGSSFVARPWQKTRVNTEAKYLMLNHAFRQLGCIRVEFKTDSLNVASRSAIQRLGAVEEGTLRNHMIVAGGRIRHSVYYSITHSEWPAISAHLQAKLNPSEKPSF